LVFTQTVRYYRAFAFIHSFMNAAHDADVANPTICPSFRLSVTRK